MVFDVVTIRVEIFAIASFFFERIVSSNGLNLTLTLNPSTSCQSQYG